MSDKNNQLSIAQKLAELDKLVKWFESDEFELETSLETFTKAETLARSIEQDLTTFKNKISVLKKDFSKE